MVYPERAPIGLQSPVVCNPVFALESEIGGDSPLCGKDHRRRKALRGGIGLQQSKNVVDVF